MKTKNLKQMQKLLRDHIEVTHGNQATYARVMGITPAYVSKMLTVGPIPKKVLKYLGYESFKTTRFRELK